MAKTKGVHQMRGRIAAPHSEADLDARLFVGQWWFEALCKGTYRWQWARERSAERRQKETP